MYQKHSFWDFAKIKSLKTQEKMDKNLWQAVHTPHLQQVLGAVYLIIGANYRNDTIIGSFIWVSNVHICTGLLSNLLNPCSTFPNDQSSQLQHQMISN